MVGGQQKSRGADVREAPDVLQDREGRALRQRDQFHLDDLGLRTSACRDGERQHLSLPNNFENAAENEFAELGLDNKLRHCRAIDLWKFGRRRKGDRRSVFVVGHMSPILQT